MGKALFIIIVIAAIGAGVYLLTQDQNPGPSVDGNHTSDAADTAAATEEYTVTYTDSGYSPQELRVPAGTEVHFENQSSNLMWTASDPHPVHSGLAEFDAHQGTAGGGDYHYTFREPGTYPYHNHLLSTHTGKIIVE